MQGFREFSRSSSWTHDRSSFLPQTSKMLINLVVFSTLILTTTNADEKKADVVHLELNGIHLFDTSETNYALTSLSFIDHGWQTVSVNGDQATFISPSCQTNIKNVEALNDEEKILLKDAFNLAITADDDQQAEAADGRTRAGSSRFALDGSWWWFTSRTLNVIKFTLSDYSFCKNDDNNFTAAKGDLPNNVARIFVHNDLITFAYNDLKLMMKPISCLDDTELKLLKELEDLIKLQLKEHPEEEEDEISKPEKIEESAGSR